MPYCGIDRGFIALKRFETRDKNEKQDVSNVFPFFQALSIQMRATLVSEHIRVGCMWGNLNIDMYVVEVLAFLVCREDKRLFMLHGCAHYFPNYFYKVTITQKTASTSL